MVSLLSGLFADLMPPNLGYLTSYAPCTLAKQVRMGFGHDLAVQQLNMWFDIPSQIFFKSSPPAWDINIPYPGSSSGYLLDQHSWHAYTGTYTSRTIIVLPTSILRKKNNFLTENLTGSLSTAWLLIWHEFIPLCSVSGKSTTGLVTSLFALPLEFELEILCLITICQIWMWLINRNLIYSQNSSKFHLSSLYIWANRSTRRLSNVLIATELGNGESRSPISMGPNCAFSPYPTSFLRVRIHKYVSISLKSREWGSSLAFLHIIITMYLVFFRYLCLK